MYGQGMGKIWLSNVRCDGNESNIASCPHSYWGRTNCAHGQDVGIVCDNGNYIFFIFKLTYIHFNINKCCHSHLEGNPCYGNPCIAGTCTIQNNENTTNDCYNNCTMQNGAYNCESNCTTSNMNVTYNCVCPITYFGRRCERRKYFVNGLTWLNTKTRLLYT